MNLVVAVLIFLAMPAPDGYVVDQAAVLSASAERQLESDLAVLEARTTIEVAVAVVLGLERQSIEAYAEDLFNQWGVGQRESNNGVLLLVALGERMVRVQPGLGLKDRLTVSRSQSIIDDDILPRRTWTTGAAAGARFSAAAGPGPRGALRHRPHRLCHPRAQGKGLAGAAPAEAAPADPGKGEVS